jgi:hypothetical protein
MARIKQLLSPLAAAAEGDVLSAVGLGGTSKPCAAKVAALE